MSIRYGNKVGPLTTRRSSFFKKDRFDRLNIKTPSNIWNRPTDWLTMPNITSTEQKIALLMPVFPQGSNFLAFTISGAYTVDWGDGVTENVASNVKAQHEYSYTDPDLNATVTSDGYKMAIVIITPQAGQNITNVDFNQKYSLTGSNFPNSSPILEIILSCPQLSSGYGSLNLGAVTALPFCNGLVSFKGVNLGFLSSFKDLVSFLPSLKNVELINTASITTMELMFAGCASLTNITPFNTSAVTNMSNMFAGCNSLTSAPLFNTVNVTNMASMFSECFALADVPLFNTAAVTNMTQMFFNCKSLNNIPLLDTTAVTNMTQMFFGCTHLTTVPLFNINLVTTLFNIFSNCRSISRGALSGNRYSISYVGLNLSKEELESIFNYLNTPINTSQTINVTSNWGAPTPVTLTGMLTDGSTTIPMVNTTGIAVGMQITGTGSPLTTAIAVTLTDAGDLVNLASHGLSNGDEVSFAAVNTTSGIVTNRIYYVVNAAAGTFQVAATLNGPALALTTDGSGTLRYRTEVVSIIPNVSITVSRPMTSSGANRWNSLTFRQLRTGTALLKGWAVTT